MLYAICYTHFYLNLPLTSGCCFSVDCSLFIVGCDEGGPEFFCVTEIDAGSNLGFSAGCLHFFISAKVDAGSDLDFFALRSLHFFGKTSTFHSGFGVWLCCLPLKVIYRIVTRRLAFILFEFFTKFRSALVRPNQSLFYRPKQSLSERGLGQWTFYSTSSSMN